MTNRWASPEGFEQPPPTVRYRILDAKSGKVVERTTQHLRDAGRGRHFLSLHSNDQEFAGEIVKLVQRACGYFYLPDEKYVPMVGVVFDWCGEPHCQHEAASHYDLMCKLCETRYCIAPDPNGCSVDGCDAGDKMSHAFRPHAVSDDEVRERIQRLDKGENTREAERTHKRAYPISELPWEQQRALVEQVERVKREWSFELIGEVTE